MSILVDESTRVVIQGITGRIGKEQARVMIEYGTNIVAGVTPGKGGSEVLGVPVYDTVKEAVKEHDANASVIYVPPPFAKDAVFEAINNGLEVIVVITEGIPVHDSMEFVEKALKEEITIIGPNCPGIMSPGKTSLGMIPPSTVSPGEVGVVSRSGTLMFEILHAISSAGLGQSTAVGIGGDRVIGTTFIDVLKLFEEDPDTKSIVLVGEVGGSAEEIAAEFIKEYISKPVVSFIAGRNAPPGKRMGHAGAIISGKTGTAETKVKALEDAGVTVVENFLEIPEHL
jgi:succinyl-CoA synthetase alpha subunit